MKKIIFTLLGATVLLGSTTTLMAGSHKQRPAKNLTTQIPVIDYKNDNWERSSGVAQSGDADWNNVVGLAANVTVKEAIEIAESHPEVTYFFIVKSDEMKLGKKRSMRKFNKGDAVFFTGEPTWSEAKGMADGYMKKSAIITPVVTTEAAN